MKNVMRCRERAAVAAALLFECYVVLGDVCVFAESGTLVQQPHD